MAIEKVGKMRRLGNTMLIANNRYRTEIGIIIIVAAMLLAVIVIIATATITTAEASAGLGAGVSGGIGSGIQQQAHAAASGHLPPRQNCYDEADAGPTWVAGYKEGQYDYKNQNGYNNDPAWPNRNNTDFMAGYAQGFADAAANQPHYGPFC